MTRILIQKRLFEGEEIYSENKLLTFPFQVKDGDLAVLVLPELRANFTVFKECYYTVFGLFAVLFTAST